MPVDKETWGDYSKLVLKELERLNESQEEMKRSLDIKFSEINSKLSDVKGIERSIVEHKLWIEKVSDVWSTTQMKEAKDEIYKQKSRWIATIAILTFLQVLISIIAAFWGKF